MLFAANLADEGGPGWFSSTCLTPSRIETFGSPPPNTWLRFYNIGHPFQDHLTSVQSSSNPVSSAKHLLIPLQKEEKLLQWRILLQLAAHSQNCPVQKWVFSEEMLNFHQRLLSRWGSTTYLRSNCRPASHHNSEKKWRRAQRRCRVKSKPRMKLAVFDPGSVKTARFSKKMCNEMIITTTKSS